MEPLGIPSRADGQSEHGSGNRLKEPVDFLAFESYQSGSVGILMV
jgi:hypothetical protein